MKPRVVQPCQLVHGLLNYRLDGEMKELPKAVHALELFGRATSRRHKVILAEK